MDINLLKKICDIAVEGDWCCKYPECEGDGVLLCKPCHDLATLVLSEIRQRKRLKVVKHAN
jgi:hypothetical protein